jgi:predicted solute-binding protein
MDFDNELDPETTETGSDELLSDDNLRLPEGASPLVRVHAVRSWLTRRQKDTALAIGEAALAWQEAQQAAMQDTTRLRRREQQRLADRVQQTQQDFQDAQQRLSVYEELAALLEEYITHTTSNERTLVEYYLQLEEMVQQEEQKEAGADRSRLRVLMDVLHRIEQVNAPEIDE